MNSPIKKLMVIVLCITASVNAKTTLSIEKALKNNLIKASVICNGGLRVNYSIKNETKDSLKIIIPAGWRMNSVKEEYQDILVTRDQILALGNHQQKIFEIKGYCCEADHSGPIEGAKYETGKMADTALARIAVYLNEHPADSNTEQYAVWAISDNKPSSNIVSYNDTTDSPLRNFVSQLKHEPVKWYTLLKRVKINSYGNIHESPIQLKGKVNYSVDEICYAYFFILDTAGNKVGIITGQWLTPGNNDYLVNVNLKDFKKGKYKIMLADKKKEFFAKEFEI